MFNIVSWLRQLRDDVDVLWAAVAEMQERRDCQIGFEVEEEEEYDIEVVPEYEITDEPLEDGSWVESGGSCGFGENL